MNYCEESLDFPDAIKKSAPELTRRAKIDKAYNLFPGMQIQCSIITGSRTVLEYLAEPFMLSFKSALLEH